MYINTKLTTNQQHICVTFFMAMAIDDPNRNVCIFSMSFQHCQINFVKPSMMKVVVCSNEEECVANESPREQPLVLMQRR